jgi:hypothetical protein
VRVIVHNSCRLNDLTATGSYEWSSPDALNIADPLALQIGQEGVLEELAKKEGIRWHHDA